MELRAAQRPAQAHQHRAALSTSSQQNAEQVSKSEQEKTDLQGCIMPGHAAHGANCHRHLQWSGSHVETDAGVSCKHTHSRRKKSMTGTSLVVQWLRPCAPNAGGTASIRGHGTKIPHTTR